jgi:AcrR family transcriptional regulator
MNEKQSMDRRIARTKLAIREALVTLIKEKGFDAITVKDIVVRANINRGTFYLHYKDKFDLLEQTETEIIKEMQHFFLQANTLYTLDSNRTDQIQQLLMVVLEYVKERADLMHAILGIQGDYSFLTRIRSIAEQNIKPGVLSGLNAENFSVPREYLIAYVFHAHLGVLQAWLAAGCKETPQEMAHIFIRLSFEGPFRAAGFGTNKI